MGTQKRLKYQQEFLRKIRHELYQLFLAHWREIALNKDKIRLNPDWDAYFQLEAEGRLDIFTARDDGVLVGYVFVLKTRHLHYKDHLMAMTDLVYLHPDHRKGWNAKRLFQFAEDCMKEDGVSTFTIGMKHHKPFSAILDRMGYSPQDVTYSKYIGG